MIKILGLSSSPRDKKSRSFDDSMSGIMLETVMDTIRNIPECTTETVNLYRRTIHPCKGCFSDMETRCHFLCDCYDDDFQSVAKKVIEADAVLFATPTYMFGMSSILKRFFERWVSFKAPFIEKEKADKSLDECFDLLEKTADGTLPANHPLLGKVGGIVVSGSELGQDNVIKEIMLILNLYGFVLPPQCFIYHTGHSMQSMEAVRESFLLNQWLVAAAENLGKSMVQAVKHLREVSWPHMPRTLTRQ